MKPKVRIYLTNDNIVKADVYVGYERIKHHLDTNLARLVAWYVEDRV